MTERKTYYHTATYLRPRVNWTVGVGVMVWALIFFTDILDISSRFAWLGDVWIRWIGVGFIVSTLFLRWMLLRRSGEYVELDDSGIRHVGAGGRSTRLLWTDVVDLRRERFSDSACCWGTGV